MRSRDRDCRCQPIGARASFALALLLATAARAQVVTNPNQVVGEVRLTSSAPAVLAILDAPGNEGCTQIGVGGVTRPPAPFALARTTPPAADFLGGPYTLTVETGAAGYVYRLGADLTLDGGRDIFKLGQQDTAPLFPEPAPDERLDFSACAGIFHFQFRDSLGSPQAVSSGTVRALRFDPALGSVAPWSWGPVDAGATTENLAAIGDGGSWDLDADVTLGSDPFVDLTRVAWASVAALPCDEVVDVPVDLPIGLGGASAHVIGRFDVLGEDEVVNVVSPPGSVEIGTSIVSARGGPWGNERYFAFTSVPASGSFDLQNLVPSTAVVPSQTYRVRGRAAFRPAFRYEILDAPELIVPLAAGATLDLGDALVYPTGLVRGRVVLAGPPAPSTLLDTVTWPCDPVDGVVPRCTGLHQGLHVGAHFLGGTSTSGATLGAGDATAMFPASLDATSASLEGDYELVLPSVEGATTSWDVDELGLDFDRRGTPADPPSYVFALPSIVDRRAEAHGIPIAPGSVADLDVGYCLSEVRVHFTTTSGTLYGPWLAGSGSFVGTDFQGRPADYAVDMTYTAPGTPLDIATAAPTGLVVIGLPQASYRMTAALNAVAPGGSTSLVILPQFTLDVGCRQIIDADPDVRVAVDASVPACTGASPVRVTGRVDSTTDVAEISWTVDGGPPTVACTPCGIAPTFGFDVPLPGGASAITVTAQDTSGRTASTTIFTHLAPEPSALDFDSAAEPLRVQRDASGGLLLTWAAVPSERFDVHVGTLRSLWQDRAYDHAHVLPCGVNLPLATLAVPATDSYFLVTTACDGAESSYGRDSFARERPPSTDACP